MHQFCRRSFVFLMRFMGLILLTMVVNLRAQAGVEIDGAAIYEKNCATCHKEGKVGAPKVGDMAAWKPRLEKGMDVMFQNAHNDSHPQCKQCTTSEVKEAIKYIANQSSAHGNFALW